MSGERDLQAGHEVGGERPPRLSFGLAVWNGEDTIRQCLDSLLAQDFTDFEVVVSDNASTDGTSQILEEYAARDPRIRVSRNQENIGQIENVNLVCRQSRGEYFRWIGVSDWLEPHYASRCVEALDAVKAMVHFSEKHVETITPMYSAGLTDVKRNGPDKC